MTPSNQVPQTPNPIDPGTISKESDINLNYIKPDLDPDGTMFKAALDMQTELDVQNDANNQTRTLLMRPTEILRG